MKALWVCGAVWLIAACDTADISPCCAVALLAGQEDRAYIPGALQATAEQFLGPAPGTPPAPGIPPDTPLTGLGRDSLSPNSATPHQTLQDRRIGLRLQANQRIAGQTPRLQTTVFAALEASHGHSLHSLPQGVGILADPARVSFDSIALTPELGVTQQIGLRDGLSLRLGASVGQRYAKVRTHFGSALLDVTNHSQQVTRFVGLEAALRRQDPTHPHRGQEFALGLHRQDDSSVTLRSDLRFWH